MSFTSPGPRSIFQSIPKRVSWSTYLRVSGGITSPTAAGRGVISRFGKCVSGLMLTSVQAATLRRQSEIRLFGLRSSLFQAHKRAVVLLRYQAHERGETD